MRCSLSLTNTGPPAPSPQNLVLITVDTLRADHRTLMNLRVSRAFELLGRARVEAIAEVFNPFNAKNPSAFVTNQTSARFMPLNEFSGDFQNPEQRVGQIGFRFLFS